jgi:hypothetical protein
MVLILLFRFCQYQPIPQLTSDCENTIHNQDFKTLVDLFSSYAEHCGMEYIQAHNRSQIRMNCLEAQIASDNQVRVLDALNFTNNLNDYHWMHQSELR